MVRRLSSRPLALNSRQQKHICLPYGCHSFKDTLAGGLRVLPAGRPACLVQSVLGPVGYGYRFHNHARLHHFVLVPYMSSSVNQFLRSSFQKTASSASGDSMSPTPSTRTTSPRWETWRTLISSLCRRQSHWKILYKTVPLTHSLVRHPLRHASQLSHALVRLPPAEQTPAPGAARPTLLARPICQAPPFHPALVLLHPAEPTPAPRAPRQLTLVTWSRPGVTKFSLRTSGLHQKMT